MSIVSFGSLLTMSMLGGWVFSATSLDHTVEFLRTRTDSRNRKAGLMRGDVCDHVANCEHRYLPSHSSRNSLLRHARPYKGMGGESGGVLGLLEVLSNLHELKSVVSF